MTSACKATWLTRLQAQALTAGTTCDLTFDSMPACIYTCRQAGSDAYGPRLSPNLPWNRHEYKMSGKQATKDFYSGEEYVTNLDSTLWGKRGVSRCVVHPTHIYTMHINASVRIPYTFTQCVKVRHEIIVLAVAGGQPPGRLSGWLSSTLRGARIACGLSRSSSGAYAAAPASVQPMLATLPWIK